MISLIIPTYNEEKAIGETLSHLTRKLTLPHEIIVSDDKSLDLTVSTARKYTNKVLSPEHKHISIAANRNAGAQKATGDFLVFMDADSSMLDPDAFFTRALADFSDHPEISSHRSAACRAEFA